MYIFRHKMRSFKAKYRNLAILTITLFDVDELSSQICKVLTNGKSIF